MVGIGTIITPRVLSGSVAIAATIASNITTGAVNVAVDVAPMFITWLSRR